MNEESKWRRLGKVYASMSRIMKKKKKKKKKNRNVFSEQVRHKPSSTSIEDDWRLEILDLESRGIVLSSLSVKRKQRR